jgi:hypothetical protein
MTVGPTTGPPAYRNERVGPRFRGGEFPALELVIGVYVARLVGVATGAG